MSALRGKDPKLAKPSRPLIVVFGAPGVGKTWTSLDFPACYYIDCEGGANLPHYTDRLKKVGAMYMGPEDGANNFDTVLEEIHNLSRIKHDRKTVIIDSFSKLFNTEIQIEHDRILEVDKKPPSFGIEKKPAVAKTRRLLRRLERVDMNAILICHEKARWQGGEEIGRTFDGWDKIEYELNLVMQVVLHGTSRRARVVKSRFSQFENGEFVEWSYDTFLERFGADLLEATATPVEPAHKDHVDEMTRLVDVLEPDEAWVKRVWDKAGVTAWSEMDAQTIVACIEYLKSEHKKRITP